MMAKPTKYRKIINPANILQQPEQLPELWQVKSSGEVYQRIGEQWKCVQSNTKTGSIIPTLNLGICQRLQ